jgi:hypothetical protein
MSIHPPITVQAADSAGARRDFLRLPQRLYASDPRWVAPLEVELRERLWGGNPFLRHASAQAWVAYAQGRAVGRISAQFDRLQQEYHDDMSGSFGLIEAEDDPAVVAALLETATAWLRGYGARRVRGPLNLSVNGARASVL